MLVDACCMDWKKGKRASWTPPYMGSFASESGTWIKILNTNHGQKMQAKHTEKSL